MRKRLCNALGGAAFVLVMVLGEAARGAWLRLRGQPVTHWATARQWT